MSPPSPGGAAPPPGAAAPARLMLVDDSPLIRKLLSKILGLDPSIDVVGTATNGREALDTVDDIDPDVVVLDVEMPIMDGLTTLGFLKRRRPDIPVVMFSTLTASGAGATLDALTRGADDYVTKPSNTGSFQRTAEEVRDALAPRVKALAARRRRMSARFVRPPATGTRSPARAVDARPSAAATRPAPTGRSAAVAPRRRIGLPPAVLVIAVSTGGPEALHRLLPALPSSLPVPVLITQHMPALFIRMLVERLDRACSLHVREGVDGVVPRPGEVWIAPGGSHMLLRREGTEVQIVLDDGPPVQSCKPAADPMFESASVTYGDRVLAAVLTGMGSDGLGGARVVRAGGGTVLCQDEPSSVVWGMPGAVSDAGLADDVVPLEDLASTITGLLGPSDPRPLAAQATTGGASC